MTGDNSGRWDGARLQQLLSNLVLNAIQYGETNTPVRVALRGDKAEIRLEVTNSGSPIEPAALDHIFDPLKRGPVQGDSQAAPADLGLGLFIVREIAKAHGGETEVRTHSGETTLPYVCLAAPALKLNHAGPLKPITAPDRTLLVAVALNLSTLLSLGRGAIERLGFFSSGIGIDGPAAPAIEW